MNFTFKRAEEIFREAFGDDELRQAGFFDFSSPFDNDPFFSRNRNDRKMLKNERDPFGGDDDFGFGMVRNMHKRMNEHMKGMFGGRDPFEDMH